MKKPILASAVATLAAASLILTGCAASPSVDSDGAMSTGIAVDSFVLGAPVFVAEANGDFEDAGLDVTPTVFQTGVEGVQAVAGGQVDFGFALDFAAVSSVSDKLVLLGTISSPTPGFHKLFFRSEITSPAQLAGGKIGVVTGSAQEYVTDKWLDMNGLTDSVEKVALPGVFELVSALKTDQVQAGFLFATALPEGRADSNLTEVGDDSEVNPTGGVHVITRREVFDKNPELVTRVLTALSSAADFIAADPDESGRITAEAIQGDAAAISASLATSELGMGMTLAQREALLSIQEFLLGTGKIKPGTDVEASLELDIMKSIVGDKVED